jgi:hypothetical protein
MWPELFGSGWVWNVLVSVSSVACFLTLGWLVVGARLPQRISDPLQRLCLRYEQGDLTRYEFERLNSLLTRRYRFDKLGVSRNKIKRYPAGVLVGLLAAAMMAALAMGPKVAPLGTPNASADIGQVAPGPSSRPIGYRACRTMTWATKFGGTCF